MLKALTETIRESGYSDLARWKAGRQASSEAAGYTSSAAAYVAHLRGLGLDPYHRSSNEKLPRAVDHDLEMFGCVACNFCITVCPNDAFTSIASLDGMEGRQQYLLFAELCNECGNCMTFCPERGDPAMIKPRLFTNAQLFADRAPTGQGFLIADGAIVDARADTESISLVQQLLASAAGNPLGPPSNR